MDVLNWDAIKDSEVCHLPYPHFVVKDAILPSNKQTINASFPDFKFPGLVPPCALNFNDTFADLLKVLDSQQLRDVIRDKLGVDLTGKPTLMTVRGRARQRDGRIHVDTPDKMVTILLYLNEQWPHDAGKIRVLNKGDDINDYIKEVPPLLGNMFVFKVTDNCWHGHLPLCASRRAIMVNYMSSQEAYDKHHKKHVRSARFKKLKQLIGA